MQSLNVLSGFAVVFVSLSSALIALWLFSFLSVPTKIAARALLSEAENKAVFIFDDDALVDSTPRARNILSTSPGGVSDWAKFQAVFGHRFPGLSEKIGTLAEAGKLTLTGTDIPPIKIHAEWWEGLAKLVLDEDTSEMPAFRIDRQSMSALEDELKTLRATAEQTPFLVWKQSPGGQITWANQSYLSLAAEFYPEETVHAWPPRHLFDTVEISPEMATAKARRAGLQLPDNRVSWYDISARPADDETLFFAMPADHIVRAEGDLNNFVQTLTKTFAQLPIGLAIFDRKRQLAVFNPALTDLSTLPFEFLSTRPTLYSFLDRLREKRMAPEPKDYKTWRDQMAALEIGAANGTYEETWTLPSGQIYRVIGRPHPDGAVAFLFEDITAEVSLTRRFRSELELGQSVIDNLDEAIVVFAPNGLVTTSNAPYVQLWGVDPRSAFGEMSVIDTAKLWEAESLPTLVWSKARDYIAGNLDRAAWSSVVELKNGTRLSCRFASLPAGHTLAGFRPVPVARGKIITAHRPRISLTV